MPTHKELIEELKDEIGFLSENVSHSSDMLQNSVEFNSPVLSRSLDNLSISIDSNTDSNRDLSSAVMKGVSALLASVVVGGTMRIQSQVMELLMDKFKEIRRKNDMINSIKKLQKDYSDLTYDFILERAFVMTSTRELRQNILNELIHEGIVTSHKNGNVEIFRIENDNPALMAYQKWFDGVMKSLDKL